MTQPLSQQTIQRLAFVRFLHAQGIAQSAQPEPMSAAAILSFQDAVEHFLLISADHLEVNLPSSMQFLQYWEKLQPKLPAGQALPGKQALGRVNKLRVDLKHHGNIPSSHAVAQSKADVTTFFTDATLMIFNVDFNSVDMVDLVAHPAINRVLHEAQTHFDAGDIVFAMGGLAIAFHELLDHYTSRRIGGFGRPPFSFGNRIPSFRPEKDQRGSAVTRQLTALTATTRELREALQVLSLGIDYARYAHFNVMVPGVDKDVEGSTKIVVTDMDRATTADDYQQARLFVIESALQAARTDATFEQLNVRFPNDVDFDIEEWTWTGPAGSRD
ncbi:hypothetical protein [Streptomyces sp. NRRL F-5053]|uniref:hypothetical protein n=1 Tax=Streptomyces sp. NRRL F-5053 TaxID=1463854 RepID=UPI0004C94133|nr:hypothetical protein [Streptomyces sp. NRRL F-5053]